MKRRSDSSLAKLDEDQLSDLYDWIDEDGYTKAQHKAAEPAPEGFGLKLHKNSLFRFFQQEQRRRHAERLAELAIKADDNAMPPEVAQVWKATRVEFAHATFELASTNCAPGGAGGANYDRVDRALHRFEIADLGRNRHQLARECALEARRQWQFDAARKALEHAAALQKIAADPVLDNQDKIWAAHDICFGPDSEPESTNPSPAETPCPASAGITSRQISPSEKSAPSAVKESESPSPSINPQFTDTLSHAVPHCTTPASSPAPQNPCPASAAMRDPANTAVSTTSPSSLSSEPSLPSFPSVKNPDPENLSKSPSHPGGDAPSVVETPASSPRLTDPVVNAEPPSAIPNPASPSHPNLTTLNLQALDRTGGAGGLTHSGTLKHTLAKTPLSEMLTPGPFPTKSDRAFLRGDERRAPAQLENLPPQNMDPSSPRPPHSATLKHDNLIFIVRPAPKPSSASIENLHSAIPNLQSGIATPQSLVPQTKSASRWMRETKQRELMKQYLIDHACDGDSDQFHPLVRSGTPITIVDPQLLRDLA